MEISGAKMENSTEGEGNRTANRTKKTKKF